MITLTQRDETVLRLVPYVRQYAQRLSSPEVSEDELYAEGLFALIDCASFYREDYAHPLYTHVRILAERRMQALVRDYEAPAEVPEGCRSDQPSQLDLILHCELADAVAGSLDCLNDMQRQAVQLCFYQGLTMRQAGRVMQVSSQRVVQLCRAAGYRIRRRYCTVQSSAKPRLTNEHVIATVLLGQRSGRQHGRHQAKTHTH